jgi:predicted transcriptional regulator
MRYGYTQAEIALYLGLHSSMVSNVIKAGMGDSRFKT